MKKMAISALAALMLAGSAHGDDSMGWYRVTITNASGHQILTPPLVVAHKYGYHLFQVGQTASFGLATQAETGNPSDLKAEADADAAVFNTAVGSGVIMPGQSLSIDIQAPGKAFISATAMLATTNDGFMGLMPVPAPQHQTHAHGMVFDAGSESNNEDCAYVPGPPCAMDSGNASDDGEGIITVHNGIHGIKDIPAMHYDWRGPIALVTINRMHGHD